MIKLPAGSHEDAGESLTWEQALKPGAFDPPNTSRADAGARVDNLVRLLDIAVSGYRKAVEAENGPDHAGARVTLNVKASFRRNSPALAALLGLA